MPSAPTSETPRQDVASTGEDLSTKDRLLNAAEECFASHGVIETTIDDLVRRTGVPRATLYRHVGGKEQIIAAIAERHLNRVLAGVVEIMSRRRSFADTLVDMTLFLVDYSHSHELARAAFSPSGAPSRLAAMTEVLPAQMQERIEGFVGVFLELYRPTGQVREGIDAREAARWLVLVTSSLTMLPQAVPPDEREALLRHMLVPAFVAPVAPLAPAPAATTAHQD